MLSLTVELTPKGLEEWQRVMQNVFAYIENMRRSPFPEFLFHERATMARLDEVYADKGEGIDRTMALSNNALLYPLELAERIDYLYTEPNPDAWFEVLDAIRPDTMIATLVNQGVPTDQTEEHYGTAYSYSEIEGAFYESLANPEVGPEITFIEPNPFVPTKVELLAQRPVKLIDEPAATLFFAQDTEFERPQVAIEIKIRQPQRSATLRTLVLKTVYQAAITEMINEMAYAASEAGLSQSLIASLEGITLSISGYNQSADELMRYVVENLTEISLSEERFEAIKDRMVRDLANADHLDAWRQARQTKRKVLQEVYFTPQEQLTMAEGITLSDLRGFARSLYSEGKIEALIYGNVTADQAREVVAFVKDSLGLRPVPEEALFEARLLIQEPGSSITSVSELEVNNSCYWSEFYLGEDSPDNRAAALVINNLLEEPFFTEVRTRQQLGYIDWSVTFPQEDELFGAFIIQSADYPADEIERRVLAFLETVPMRVEELSEEDFETLVAGVRAQVEEKDKSIAERAARYFLMAYEYDEDWDRKSETLAALDRLTREDVAALLQTMFAEESRRVRTVLAFARQHESASEIEASYEDVEIWKRSQKFD